MLPMVASHTPSSSRAGKPCCYYAEYYYHYYCDYLFFSKIIIIIIVIIIVIIIIIVIVVVIVVVIVIVIVIILCCSLTRQHSSLRYVRGKNTCGGCRETDNWRRPVTTAAGSPVSGFTCTVKRPASVAGAQQVSPLLPYL